jgi:hypothetical protein
VEDNYGGGNSLSSSRTLKLFLLGIFIFFRKRKINKDISEKGVKYG